MTQVTNNERSVLRAILTNDYAAGNGAIPETFVRRDWVWSNCVDCARETPLVEGKALSGVCGSLAQKGLVETDGNTGREACICLTEEGYRVAMEGPAQR